MTGKPNPAERAPGCVVGVYHFGGSKLERRLCRPLKRQPSMKEIVAEGGARKVAVRKNAQRQQSAPYHSCGELTQSQ
jgi:hypothetical protein